MKNILTLLTLTLFTLSSFAQQRIIEELEPFLEIKTFDRIEAILIKSTENKVVITGDDQDDVNISNKKGLLKVKMDFENQFDGGDVTVKVYHTETLTSIDCNESSNITSEDTITGSVVRITAQEGGKIDLKVDIEELYTKSTSGAEITLSGKAVNQEVVANSGGKVLNKDLNTTKTKVSVNAGGTARVNAKDKMEAKVRAGGSIYIYGNPKDLKRNKVFGGSIKVIE